MDLTTLEEEAWRIRQQIHNIKNTIDSALDPERVHLKDASYNDRN